VRADISPKSREVFRRHSKPLNDIETPLAYSVKRKPKEKVGENNIEIDFTNAKKHIEK